MPLLVWYETMTRWTHAGPNVPGLSVEIHVFNNTHGVALSSFYAK